ncbi:MAG: hypothetical protein ACE5LA_04090, partial [Dehalococcoidales bacterium]
NTPELVELWGFHFWSFWAIVEFFVIFILWYKFDRRIEKLKGQLKDKDRIIARLRGKTEEEIKEDERWNEMTEEERLREATDRITHEIEQKLQGIVRVPIER